MSVLAVAALEIKRPSGAFIRVGNLISASVSLEPQVVSGVLSSNWATNNPSLVTWTLSVEAKNTPGDRGLTAARAACRNGESVEVEAVLGDGYRISGTAYVENVGRGGAWNSAFQSRLHFIGAGKLCGIYEASYPTAPVNLAVDSVTKSGVTLSWDEVASVDGYYIYWGPSSGSYTHWEKIPVGSLSDSANPDWTLTGLPTQLLYFSVSSYTD